MSKIVYYTESINRTLMRIEVAKKEGYTYKEVFDLDKIDLSDAIHLANRINEDNIDVIEKEITSEEELKTEAKKFCDEHNEDYETREHDFNYNGTGIYGIWAYQHINELKVYPIEEILETEVDAQEEEYFKRK